MNKYIIVGIIVALLFGGGIYAYNSTRTARDPDGINNIKHGEEDTTDKSIAQSHRSYKLEVTSNSDGIKPNQPVTFKYKVKNDKGEVLNNYTVMHEKTMHFLLVRKDLQNFQHLHPDYNQSTGEFSINITFPTDGPYRLFPDFTPADENPQKLPVTLSQDINAGDLSKYSPQAVAADANPIKTIEGYSISYKLNPEQPKTQNNFTYTLTIAKNGQPVTDLETYLGALGHSVILKEGTLDFIHTHAGESGAADTQTMEHGSKSQNTSTMGPDINFSTTFPEPGFYKLFTQFQHQGKVITTDYTIQVN